MIAATLLINAMPSPANAQRSMAEGFSSFELQSARNSYGYKRVLFGDGTEGERFELRHGDCPLSTGDCSADRTRIEFSEQNPAQPVGSEVWVAWSLYLPADFPNQGGRTDSNVILGQFHQRGTSGPIMLFSAYGGQMELSLSNPYRLDDDPMNPIGAFREVTVAPLANFRGRYNRFMVNARWSRGEDGFIRVYLNGKQVWSYDGPTTNANDPVYFKYGVYRSFISRCGGACRPLVAFYSDVRRGKSRAAVE